MKTKSYFTAALIAATGLALAMPVLAQTAVPIAPNATATRPMLFDFAGLDANADGMVTTGEVIAAHDAALAAGGLVGRGLAPNVPPLTFFDRFDENTDGAISIAEYEAAQTAVLGRMQGLANIPAPAVNPRTNSVNRAVPYANPAVNTANRAVRNAALCNANPQLNTANCAQNNTTIRNTNPRMNISDRSGRNGARGGQGNAQQNWNR